MKLYKKGRHYYWLFTGFIRKHVVLITLSLIGAFLLIIFFINFFPFFSSVMFHKREIIGIIGTYTPRKLPSFVAEQISNPLIVIDQNGDIQPLLANSWEYLDSGKTYRLHLRNDLYWSDKSRFKAGDMDFVFTDVKVTSVDDFTLDFQLKEPLNIFPIYLTRPVLKYPLIGVGALYRVEAFKQKGTTLRSINLAPNKPELPYKIYKFFDAETDLITAYKKGDITQFATPDKETAYQFEKWKNSNILRTVDYNKIMTIFYNTQSGPLQERDIRKALAYATPAMPERGEPAYGPIPPTSWAYSSDMKHYTFDPERAQELIDKNLTASDEASLKLYTFFEYIDIAEALKKSYGDFGVKVDVKVVSAPPQEFDMFLTVWSPPTDPDQYFFWHSTQGATNITRFNSLKIDKLLEDGRKVLNVKQRQSIYKDFQKNISDELPAHFLYHPYEFTVLRK